MKLDLTKSLWIPEGTDWIDFIPAEYQKQHADIELKTGEKYFTVYPNAGAFTIQLTEFSSRRVKYSEVKKVKWLNLGEISKRLDPENRNSSEDKENL